MLKQQLLDLAHPLVRQAQSLITRVVRGTTLGVRVLASDGEQVLLVRHSYVTGWHLPGGAVDPHETAEAAAIRELSEETCHAPAGPLRFIGLYFNPACAGRDHVALFHLDRWSMERPFKPGGEIVEIGFFPVTDLPAGTTEATRRRLAELRGDAARSELW